MKNLIKALSFAAIVGIFAASCKQGCSDTGSHGSCSGGVVTCTPGWEKDAAGACNIEIDAKFIGNWTATDDCIEDGLLPHPVVITANNTRKIKIDIKGLHYLASTIECDLDLENGTKFTIPSTTVDNKIFLGGGSINTSGNTIVVNYTVDGTLPCIATLIKQ